MKFLIAVMFVLGVALAGMGSQLFSGAIEADLTSRARGTLDEQGFDRVSVSFDQLDATLTGNVSSKAVKAGAAAVVNALPGARVTDNQITFGRDQPASLSFVGGAPIRVSGRTGIDLEKIGFGEGFDTTGVEVVPTSEVNWGGGSGLADFTKKFFELVPGGELGVEGDQIRVAGEVPNAETKWQLLDQAEGMGEGLDVQSGIGVATATSFSLAVKSDRYRAVFVGAIGSERLHAGLTSGLPDSDVQAFEIDLRCSTPDWLLGISPALRQIIATADSAEIKLSPAVAEVRAAFPHKLWMESAERSFRAALPSAIVPQIDFSIVRAAKPDDGVEKVANQLPLQILISDDRMELSGTVKQKSERDELIRKLKSCRPDLTLTSELRYTWKEPELTRVREALPDVLAYAVSGLHGYGVIDLDAEHWSIRGGCRQAVFKESIVQLALGLDRLAGIKLDVSLEVIPEGSAVHPEESLEKFTVFFKKSSAQISPLQSEKVAALIAHIRAGESLPRVELTGFDRGDGRLALQRARALRRVLAKGGVPQERVEILAERAEGPYTWRSDRIEIGIETEVKEEELTQN